MTAVGAVGGVIVWVRLSGPITRAPCWLAWARTDGRGYAPAGPLDRWTAGPQLMQSANPQGWREMMAGARLAATNVEVLDACRIQTARTGKTHRRVLQVHPAGERGK